MSYSSSNTGAGVDAAVDEVQAVSGSLVGTTDTQTLTNKTIDPSANIIDGDKLDVDWNPSNYTPDSSISEADDVDDLAAHLKGIDIALRDIWKTLDPGFMTLPKFEDNGPVTSYTVKIGPSRGLCKDKYFYFTSALTTSAIGTPVADTYYYLYFDYSAMTDEAELTNSELIWSTTAPTHNDTYGQMMNGDDRFTGLAVLTNSTPDNIIPFIHTGSELVRFDADTRIIDRALANITTSFVAQDVTAPDFNEDSEVLIVFRANVGGSCEFYVRKTGSSSTEGELVAAVYYDSNIYGNVRQRDVNTVRIPINSSQQFDLKGSAASAIEFSIAGYFMPRGMGR